MGKHGKPDKNSILNGFYQPTLAKNSSFLMGFYVALQSACSRMGLHMPEYNRWPHVLSQEGIA
jgi:hypothetical protein